MSFYKNCAPKQVGLSEFGQVEKCSIKEKAEIEHTYAALQAVAESQHKGIIESFKELYKECCYLRILMNWSRFQPLTEEEKKRENNSEAEADDEEHCKKIYKFVKIMSTDYENITVGMKKEAFRLFPEVISEVGNVGEEVFYDVEEGGCMTA